MLGLKCAWEEKSCSLCKQNNTQCMYLPETRSGRLIDTPKHANVVGRISEHSYHRSIQPWMLLNASHEFLSEKSGMVREPEDLSQMKENPARLWPEDCEPHMFLSSPFAQALEEFPDDESQDLPLPSSDLLRTISNTISRAEAQDSKLEAADYSESMNGSSLLALGVLLQEYTRYLL
ncbi:hypothetical protein EV183_001933 [Coemansia sp. RSA 2336]|nr:hypothetical protein EV183_001933 [Coemansia sp. RSA 2336]